MRKLRFLTGLLTLCIMLSSCSRVIVTPADELCVNSWSNSFDNGNSASLSFGEDTCSLVIENRDYVLDISGIYAVTDDSLIICDADLGVHYTFSYRLHGDRVELYCNGGTLELLKSQ